MPDTSVIGEPASPFWRTWVYVLDHKNKLHFEPGPFQEVEYFHGEVFGYIMAQMTGEVNVRAKDMMNLSGWFVRAVTRFQQLFRNRVRATQMIMGRLLPGQILCGHRGLARLVASYMPVMSRHVEPLKG